MREVRIKDMVIGPDRPLALIAGPCVIESEGMVLQTVEGIMEIAQKLDIPFIFKSSYSKANRLSVNSFTGPGLEDGLRILARVKEEWGVPVLTDVHSSTQVKAVAQVVDLLQIPAFLCRQTELLLEAARSGLPLNIKKGQFMAPQDMGYIADKAESVGNGQILLTERGTTFGYRNLVVDMRSLAIMGQLGYPVVFDATHSVQLPGGGEGRSGGQREFVPLLLRAAVAAGCQAIYLEVHPQPEEALSDSASQWPLGDLERLLLEVKDFEEVRRSWDEIL
jgi:2-dehydro-3-deoxyphosphooctonate aldolase (KDO 8-P synthase)